MQKTLLTLALVAGLTGAAHAQHSIRDRSQPATGVSFGAKAGGSLTSLIAENSTLYESIYGYHAGVFANIILDRRFSFQPELLYSQKGAKYPIGGGAFTTRRFHNLDIPLAFHAKFNGFLVEAGPQIGILLAAQDMVAGGESVTLEKKYFTAAEFGFLGGLGYQRASGLGIGLRYNGGLTNLGQSGSIGTVLVQGRARNSALQLYLSYSILAGSDR
jgi:hypothetical protein